MEYIILGLIVIAAVYLVSNTKSSASSKKKVVKKSTPSVAQLKKLTKVQLLEYADKNNIKVKRSGSKAEVVKTISSHK
tara:strand:+ start:1183 stop:1416 length:234 start_codon:yes stop_codon:yes gene_type:complete